MKKPEITLVNGREHYYVFLNCIVSILESNGEQGALLTLKDTICKSFHSL